VFIHVAIPSVLTNCVARVLPAAFRNYYNFSYERVADYYGGVTEDEREHSWLSDIDRRLQELILYGG